MSQNGGIDSSKSPEVGLKQGWPADAICGTVDPGSGPQCS
jgi:hypothetical protein